MIPDFSGRRHNMCRKCFEAIPVCTKCGYHLDEGDCTINGVCIDCQIDEDLYDDHDYEPGPCDDCDDKKMPYAMRSCETCQYGGKGSLGTLRVDEEDFDEWKIQTSN